MRVAESGVFNRALSSRIKFRLQKQRDEYSKQQARVVHQIQCEHEKLLAKKNRQLATEKAKVFSQPHMIHLTNLT